MRPRAEIEKDVQDASDTGLRILQLEVLLDIRDQLVKNGEDLGFIANELKFAPWPR